MYVYKYSYSTLHEVCTLLYIYTLILKFYISELLCVNRENENCKLNYMRWARDTLLQNGGAGGVVDVVAEGQAHERYASNDGAHTQRSDNHNARRHSNGCAVLTIFEYYNAILKNLWGITHEYFRYLQVWEKEQKKKNK